jgi:hypothetical protein
VAQDLKKTRRTEVIDKELKRAKGILLLQIPMQAHRTEVQHAYANTSGRTRLSRR